MEHKLEKPTAIDLFCGSGGVTLGLKNAGFNVIGALDLNKKACATYRANHPEVRLVEKDIKETKPSEFSDLVTQQLDILAICAPCQPFSTQNRNKNGEDTRNNLLNASLPFVRFYLPKIIFVENVPGLQTTEVFKRFVAVLRRQGYSVSKPIKVNAAELGVPQRRMRVILIATKGINLKIATNISRASGKTVFESIGDLEVPHIGASSYNRDPLHFSRKHSDLNLSRLKHIPANGGGRESLPSELQLTCHIGKKTSSFSDTYGRMSWDEVSPTLTTGCTDITRGRFAHPEQHRAITLREAARLQSFPDEYIFIGSAAEIATQIGNAVPPTMMNTIARSLYKALE
jgi:DNA (cytosine-5)-methyltransferase 1